MEYKLIKEDIREIASAEEIEKFEKAQDKLERDNYAKTMPIDEMFDMCMYFKIITDHHREGLFNLHYEQNLGGSVTGSQIAAQRRKIAKCMTASHYWGDILQEKLDKEGKTFKVNQTVNRLVKLLAEEKKYEGTRSKKIGPIKEEKQKLLDEINEVLGGKEPGEE